MEDVTLSFSVSITWFGSSTFSFFIKCIYIPDAWYKLTNFGMNISK